ncbi:peptidoglycan -binding protein [Terasakiella sp. A23]|uniref:peptidoglycan -binding protein n=1 Tax=Terasakiella sp. FCG-A23 TaxID=3080561 RepID=UPI002954B389|nr:peptidoglycan -binding protein [Terasakiella sp. A23]MDV7341301.1 peptidoglycan -binding protein [Terasakiella sp. A23]
MALGRRRRIHQDNIWPGFVDALATLLMVIIFLLMIFVLAQIFLSETLSGRENTLDRLNTQMSELTDLLNLERKANEDLRDNMSNLSTELQASVKLRDDLSGRLESLEKDNAQINEKLADAFKTIEADRETLEVKLAELAKMREDVAALEALRDDLTKEIREQASKLDQKDGQLIEERQLAESERAQKALMNKQLAALRQQLAAIQEALDASETLNEEQKTQIKSLGKRLNAALATKVQELNKYRSEFFGELRKVLGKQSGVRIVGDRFVFQSEVLFQSGQAKLGAEGVIQLKHLAKQLKEISAKIPNKVNWILRVDGHTDDIPIKNIKFPSNWELSTQRAISVVKALIEEGIAPERLAATGFGEFQPIDPKKDEIARRRNRRIELKLTQR